MLNAGLSPEHEEKLGSRIDGIGLYRTEIPFMLQSGFPSEEEQVAQYQGMLQMFNDKPVTLRTWTLGRINSCRICQSVKKTRAWAGVGSALRWISLRSS